MGLPFEEPLTVDSLRVGALVLSAMGAGRKELSRRALSAIERGSSTIVEASPTTPLGGFLVTPRMVLFCVCGTENFLQALLNVLGSVQVDVGPGVGKVAAYFADVAAQYFAASDAIIAPLLPTRRLIFLGHSLGGATVQILARKWGPQALSTRTIVYGCPRVGNADFAAGAGPTTTRVENTIDPIVSLPPKTWLGVGSPWYFPTPFLASYDHALGEVKTVYADGGITTTENHVSVESAFQQVVAGGFESHGIEEYLRRLDLASAQVVPGTTFADPEFLAASEDLLLETNGPNLGRGEVRMANLTQGIMYFRSREQTQGWSESWYAVSDPASMIEAMRSLITKRAKFLTSTAEIFMMRASIVEPGVPRFSIPERLQTPVRGGGSANIKDNSTGSNEIMDCIEMRVLGVGGSRKIYAARSVPDTWINETALTSEGLSGVKMIEAYLAAVKNAGLGLRILTVGAKTQIVSLGQQAGTKLVLVTATGHGFPFPPARTVVILRGIKANPMLNGRWEILVIDANTYTLSKSSRWQVEAANDGTYQKYTPATSQIGSYAFNRVATRRTGVPFGSLRGRRSARMKRA